MKYFFFRRGGNEPSEGAYIKYVTELRRNFLLLAVASATKQSEV
ncbi:hypothetical protein [Campylobacter showae]|uniref:Uncharacterized protein n=1 Tax=Campylobacter showae RM3277 TaxID=553219 RepID=C6RHB5_9BACT|nr:hypothetical protein [Campylobacter showae]EET79132.1 hypothetical protein CAMSH0001_0742 [Campylobacter showae RM3277]